MREAQMEDDLRALDSDEREKLSSIIGRVFNPHRGVTTLGAMMEELDHHGMALVLIIFSFPSALPLPAPGYSTVLSIPLMLMGIALLKGQQAVRLPVSISRKQFDLKSFSKLTRLMERIALFLEKFSRPRFAALVRSRLSRTGIGVLICLLAFSMFIPLPGTNTLPAGGIFLIGFSFLEDDALFLFIGIIWSVLALIFSCLVIFLGYEGAKLLVKSVGPLLGLV